MKSLSTSNFLRTYPILLKYFLRILAFGALSVLTFDLIVRMGYVERLDSLLPNSFMIENFGKPITFLLITLFVPIVEECAFRLYLVYNYRFVSISGALLFYIFISITFDLLQLNPDIFLFIVRILISLAIFCVLFYFLRKDSRERQTFNLFWKDHSKAIFWFSVILFGIIHLENYELTMRQAFFFPLIIFPQMVAGYYLAKIRLDHGLIWSIQLHMVINLLASLRLWLM